MASRKPENQPTETPGDGPWNEIVGLLLFGIGFVITLALVSYSSQDPCFNTTGMQKSWQLDRADGSIACRFPFSGIRDGGAHGSSEPFSGRMVGLAGRSLHAAQIQDARLFSGHRSLDRGVDHAWARRSAIILSWWTGGEVAGLWSGRRIDGGAWNHWRHRCAAYSAGYRPVDRYGLFDHWNDCQTDAG
ncbi:MAG: DNA translocase FtsK 4TM domain-containing protein [Acidobacteria bacterium]|nr:DNA translocase FtsK 4TM domain-containing protein [Acidobacteriota bacterium]